MSISSVCLRTLKRFQQLLVETCSQKTPPWAQEVPVGSTEGSSFPCSTTSWEQKTESRRWDLCWVQSTWRRADPCGCIKLRLCKELKFPGWRTSRGSAVVEGLCSQEGEWGTGVAQVGVQSSSDNFSSLSCKRNQREGDLLGCQPRWTILFQQWFFPGLGYRLPLSSIHLPDPFSSSSPSTSHLPSSQPDCSQLCTLEHEELRSWKLRRMRVKRVQGN